VAESLHDSRLATIADRVKELKRRIAQGELAGEAATARERLRSVQLLPAMPCDPGPELRAKRKLRDDAPNPWLGGGVPAVIEGSSLAMFLHDTDAEGRETAIGKSGCIPESTPRVLAMLDAELAACVAEEAKASPLMRAARSIAGLIDDLVENEGFMIHGNFSGSPEAIARHARAMKKRFALGIVVSPESGGARRIRAAPEVKAKDDNNGRRARARGAPLEAVA